MAEQLNITGNSKEEIYNSLYENIILLTEGETNVIANMANITAAIKETFGFLWVGFYIVDGNELILGPFQGPIACTRIRKGRGVCGTSWSNEKTLIVPDVNEFPGHISCNPKSKSEIVIPVFVNNNIYAVLDIDSDQLNTFDDTDEKYLKKIVEIL